MFLFSDDTVALNKLAIVQEFDSDDYEGKTFAVEWPEGKGKINLCTAEIKAIGCEGKNINKLIVRVKR